MRLLGPSSFIITFSKDQSPRGFTKYLCLFVLVHLTGSHQGSEDITSPH